MKKPLAFVFSTLKSRMLAFFVPLILIMGFAGFVLYFKTSTFFSKYNQLLENILAVNQLADLVNSNAEILLTYKATGSRNYIASLNSNKETMNLLILGIKTKLLGPYFDDKLLGIKNLAINYSLLVNSMLFSEESDKARLTADAERSLEELLKGSRELYRLQIDEIRQEYRGFEENKRQSECAALAVLFVVTALGIFAILVFTNRLLRPIETLTSAARELSAGNFKIRFDAADDSIEEIGVLYRAFKKMTENLDRYIAELNEKVDLEKKLKEEEVKHERDHALLKGAELMALQSQVNPHFMFNTLNIIAKIAYLENAEQTTKMIAAMSGMLRYSLRSGNRIVLLSQELANLDDYIFIQNTRFGGRISFVKRIECDPETVSLPCLTIQPLVENAVIHGIEGKEEGGRIEIRCYREGEDVVATVKDDGVGIDGEKLRHLKEGRADGKGHTTGLGVNNVRERLELFYDREDVFQMTSAPGKGTEVRLRLPRLAPPGGAADV